MQNVINTPDSPDAISDTSLGQEEEKEDGGGGGGKAPNNLGLYWTERGPHSGRLISHHPP